MLNGRQSYFDDYRVERELVEMEQYAVKYYKEGKSLRSYDPVSDACMFTLTAGLIAKKTDTSYSPVSRVFDTVTWQEPATKLDYFLMCLPNWLANWKYKAAWLKPKFVRKSKEVTVNVALTVKTYEVYVAPKDHQFFVDRFPKLELSEFWRYTGDSNGC